MTATPPARQRFRSLSTSLPDVDGNKGFDLPFNVLSNYDPLDECYEGSTEDVTDIMEKKLEREVVQVEDKSPVGRFRRLVRAIIVQNRWTRFASKMADNDQMVKVKEMSHSSNQDVLTFNPGAFRSNSNAQQNIPTVAKALLCKPSWQRTDEDLQVIFKAIENLMIFKKFPMLVKQELTRSLQYEAFEDGRIIIQQGHPGVSLYFIMKGSVAVEVATTDKNTGKIYKQIVNEIMAGGSFGEMALMSGMNRAATCICIGNSEFLRIDKHDFQQVLMRSFHKEWERRTTFMKDCILFKDWMYKEIRAAGATSSIKEFPNNKVIVKDLLTHRGSVYVVMSGTCLVVSKVTVIKETLPYGKESMKMIPFNKCEQIELTRYQRKEEIFLVIRKLIQGDCFGIGEHLPETSVISENKVEVLKVPTIHILRHGRGQTLEKTQETEMKKYPTLRSAFQNFQNHRDWKHFKKEIRDDVTARKMAKRYPYRTYLDQPFPGKSKQEPPSNL